METDGATQQLCNRWLIVKRCRGKLRPQRFFSRLLNVTKQMFVVCFSPEYEINSVNSSVERAGGQRETEVDKGQAKHRKATSARKPERNSSDLSRTTAIFRKNSELLVCVLTESGIRLQTSRKTSHLLTSGSLTNLQAQCSTTVSGP